MVDTKMEDLKIALKGKNCKIEKHSNVMEITFEKEEDADWFENIFEFLQREAAVCCLMPIRPKNTPPKFIFNIKDMNKLIDLINEK
jgi:hypothetical protein